MLELQQGRPLAQQVPGENVKEQHRLEMDSGEAFFCGLLDVEDHETTPDRGGQSNIVDFMDGAEYTIDETFGGRVLPGLPEATTSETAAEPPFAHKGQDHFGSPSFEGQVRFELRGLHP